MNKAKAPKDLYAERAMVKAYPEMDKLAHDAFHSSVVARNDDKARIERVMLYTCRLAKQNAIKKILVLGCGPQPEPSKVLIDQGYDVISVEPVPSFVETASSYLGADETVVEGAAESIPVADGSQQLVFLESVLEHVDSVPVSLAEIYRVLAPGGFLYLSTTNRHQFSLRGYNGEYHVPFYNWLPKLVKECYVHDHLHFRPNLANFTERPAVHWFSYTDLCEAGREAGFARFYSFVDLMRATDESIAKSKVRRLALNSIQRSPWIRALALTQIGGHILMWKREIGA